MQGDTANQFGLFSFLRSQIRCGTISAPGEGAMLSDAEIVEVLSREVYSASDRLAEARRKVDAIISELTDLFPFPYPDEQYRLTNAIKEHITAREALHQVLERNSAFTLYGIIPEDLRQKPMGRAVDSQQIQASRLPRASGEN